MESSNSQQSCWTNNSSKKIYSILRSYVSQPRRWIRHVDFSRITKLFLDIDNRFESNSVFIWGALKREPFISSFVFIASRLHNVSISCEIFLLKVSDFELILTLSQHAYGIKSCSVLKIKGNTFLRGLWVQTLPLSGIN